jgi:hypothetical protein
VGDGDGRVVPFKRGIFKQWNQAAPPTPS